MKRSSQNVDPERGLEVPGQKHRSQSIKTIGRDEACRFVQSFAALHAVLVTTALSILHRREVTLVDMSLIMLATLSAFVPVVLVARVISRHSTRNAIVISGSLAALLTVVTLIDNSIHSVTKQRLFEPTFWHSLSAALPFLGDALTEPILQSLLIAVAAAGIFEAIAFSASVCFSKTTSHKLIPTKTLLIASPMFVFIGLFGTTQVRGEVHPLGWTRLFDKKRPTADTSPALERAAIDVMYAGTLLNDVRQRYEDLSVQPAMQSPDVIIVLVESLRSDALSPTGTPNLFAFSETAAVAEHHFSTGNTSDYGLFGLLYGLDATLYPEAIRWKPAMPKLFRQAGYVTAYLGMADFVNFGWNSHATPPEFDLFKPRSDENFLVRDERTVRETVALLNREGSYESLADRPVFAVISIYTPHFDYPSAVEDRIFTPATDSVVFALTAGNREKIWNRYRNSVRSADRIIRPLLEREDCITIVCGDHGETFYEDGRWIHGTALSKVQLSVPFLIAGPNIDSGTITETTTHHDALPTLVDTLGWELKHGDTLHGKSMLSDIRRETIAVGNLVGETTGLLPLENSEIFADVIECSLATGNFRWLCSLNDVSGRVEKTDPSASAERLSQLMKQRFAFANPLERYPEKLNSILSHTDGRRVVVALRWLQKNPEWGEYVTPKLIELAKSSNNEMVRRQAAALAVGYVE